MLSNRLIALKLVLDEAQIIEDWKNYDSVNDYRRVVDFIGRLDKYEDVVSSLYTIRNGQQVFLDSEDEIHAPRLNIDLREIYEHEKRGGEFLDLELIPSAKRYYSKFRKNNP